MGARVHGRVPHSCVSMAEQCMPAIPSLPHHMVFFPISIFLTRMHATSHVRQSGGRCTTRRTTGP
jgi:hypothetical protein